MEREIHPFVVFPAAVIALSNIFPRIVISWKSEMWISEKEQLQVNLISVCLQSWAFALRMEEVRSWGVWIMETSVIAVSYTHLLTLLSIG